MLRELYSDLIISRVIVNGRYESTEGNTDYGSELSVLELNVPLATIVVTTGRAAPPRLLVMEHACRVT